MTANFSKALLAGATLVCASLFALADEPPSPAQLAEQLAASDVNTRREAAYQLARLGPRAKEALPALINALDDSDKQVWSNAIGAIASLGPEAQEAIPRLLDHLGTRNSRAQRPRERSQVLFRSAFALSRIGAPAIPQLISALSADDPALREGAARALGGIGSGAHEAVPALVDNLGHDDAAVRREAVDALGNIGLPAKTKLLAAVAGERAKIRAGALMALGQIGKPAADAAPILFDRLPQERDPDVRAALLTALSRLGAEPNLLVPVLIGGLKEENEQVRTAAVNGLVVLRAAYPQSLPALIALLRDDNPLLSQRAAEVLGSIGSAAAPAAAALVSVASERRPPPPACLNALVQIGEPALPEIFRAVESVNPELVTNEHWSVIVLREFAVLASSQLRSALVSPGVSLRLAAARALGAAGPQPGRPEQALIEALGDKDSRVRSVALEALVALKADPSLLLPRVEAGLKDPSPDVRLAALRLIPQLGDAAQPLASAVTAALADPDETVRRTAIEGVGPAGHDAMPLLLARVADPSLRPAVIAAFGRLGAAASPAVPKLIELIPSSPKELRSQIFAALGKIGPSANAALPALTEALSDSSPEIRAAALSAAAAIQPDHDKRVAVLSAGLDDADASVRKNAAAGLGALGEKAAAAAPRLIALLRRDGDRAFALDALRPMQLRAVAPLVEMLQVPDEYVRLYAAERLGRIAADNPEAVAALQPLIEDQHDTVRREARRALARVNARK